MRPGAKAWTDEEFAKMQQMIDDGASPDEMAKALGRSLVSVRNKLANRTSVARQPIIVAPQSPISATRSGYVTATLMGDPPHGRSALDQRGRP